jgi:hypothetical protein
MKRILMCNLAVLALSVACGAAPITCSGTLISITAGGASPTIICDGLIFSNFSLVNLSGTTAGHLDINNVTFDNATNVVVLNENPNLGAAGHEDLLFTVSGPLNGIDLSVGGTVATVTERACGNPIPVTGILANLCTNTGQTISASPLGQLTVHSGDPSQPLVVSFATTSPVYIFKDIGTATGGGLSTLNESFHSAVPEPATMALSGFALIGLGLVRRRPRSA